MKIKKERKNRLVVTPRGYRGFFPSELRAEAEVA